jgi:hypothetical protein
MKNLKVWTWRNIYMDELKTLKDLIGDKTYPELEKEDIFSVLKAEAVKWVKKRQIIDKCPNCEKSRNSPCDSCGCHWELRCPNKEFVDFFNLTEEDFKNE